MVSCHEIGHALGLNHADNNASNKNIGTCLDVTQDPAGLTALGPRSDLQPGSNDFALLRTIYGVRTTVHTNSGSGTINDYFPAVLDVAEPGSTAAFAAGLGVLIQVRRRRRVNG